MGIKDLNKLIEKYSPNGKKSKFLHHYSGKVITIDTSIYLYQGILDSGNIYEPMIKHAMRLLSNGIIPLYIFDGKPPPEKDNVINKRKEDKQELVKKRDCIAQLIKQKETEDTKEEINENLVTEFDNLSIKELKKIFKEIDRKIVFITKEMTDGCKKLFNLMGIPYIQARGEADPLCARLVKDGIAYGCISQDFDILAHGGNILLRNFKNWKNEIDEYYLPDILQDTKLQYDEFLDVCILCGCDYSQTIRNIGVERGFKYIKEYNNIENLLEFIKRDTEERLKKKKKEKYIVPEDFDYLAARKEIRFASDREELDNLKKYIKLQKPNMKELEKFIDELGIIKIPTITNVKKNLMKFYETIMNFNSKITDFYSTK